MAPGAGKVPFAPLAGMRHRISSSLPLGKHLAFCDVTGATLTLDFGLGGLEDLSCLGVRLTLELRGILIRLAGDLCYSVVGSFDDLFSNLAGRGQHAGCAPEKLRKDLLVGQHPRFLQLMLKPSHLHLQRVVGACSASNSRESRCSASHTP